MKSRDSRFEILRVIAMLLILLSHFAYHGSKCVGGIESINNPYIRMLFRVFYTGGFGNVFFMLITGYFLCKSEFIKYRRLLDIVVQVFTYSFGCYLVHQYFIATQFHVDELINAVTPLTHGTYWYFTTYTLIYIFHPYINIVINNLGKEGLQRFIYLTLLIWCVIPLVFNVPLERNNFIIFFMAYSIGAYLRLYSANWLKEHLKKIIISCMTIWIIVSTPFLENTDIHNRLYVNGSPIVLALCGSVFLMFISKKANYSRLINLLGSCVGGVYLLHENPYVRSLLYTKIFHLQHYIETIYFPFVLFGFVIITFIVGVILEYIRKQMWNRTEPFISKCINRIFRISLLSK